MKGDGLGADGWADEDEEEEDEFAFKLLFPDHHCWEMEKTTDTSLGEFHNFSLLKEGFQWIQKPIFGNLFAQDENATKGPGRELPGTSRSSDEILSLGQISAMVGASWCSLQVLVNFDVLSWRIWKPISKLQELFLGLKQTTGPRKQIHGWQELALEEGVRFDDPDKAGWFDRNGLDVLRVVWLVKKCSGIQYNMQHFIATIKVGFQTAI